MGIPTNKPDCIRRRGTWSEVNRVCTLPQNARVALALEVNEPTQLQKTLIKEEEQEAILLG